jgi:hypothetical protein
MRQANHSQHLRARSDHARQPGTAAISSAEIQSLRALANSAPRSRQAPHLQPCITQGHTRPSPGPEDVHGLYTALLVQRWPAATPGAAIMRNACAHRQTPTMTRASLATSLPSLAGPRMIPTSGYMQLQSPAPPSCNRNPMHPPIRIAPLPPASSLERPIHPKLCSRKMRRRLLRRLRVAQPHNG